MNITHTQCMSDISRTLHATAHWPLFYSGHTTLVRVSWTHGISGLKSEPLVHRRIESATFAWQESKTSESQLSQDLANCQQQLAEASELMYCQGTPEGMRWDKNKTKETHWFLDSTWILKLDWTPHDFDKHEVIDHARFAQSFDKSLILYYQCLISMKLW